MCMHKRLNVDVPWTMEGRASERSRDERPVGGGQKNTPTGGAGRGQLNLCVRSGKLNIDSQYTYIIYTHTPEDRTVAAREAAVAA